MFVVLCCVVALRYKTKLISLALLYKTTKWNERKKLFTFGFRFFLFICILEAYHHVQTLQHKTKLWVIDKKKWETEERDRVSESDLSQVCVESVWNNACVLISFLLIRQGLRLRFVFMCYSVEKYYFLWLFLLQF